MKRLLESEIPSRSAGRKPLPNRQQDKSHLFPTRTETRPGSPLAQQQLHTQLLVAHDQLEVAQAARPSTEQEAKKVHVVCQYWESTIERLERALVTTFDTTRRVSPRQDAGRPFCGVMTGCSPREGKKSNTRVTLAAQDPKEEPIQTSRSRAFSPPGQPLDLACAGSRESSFVFEEAAPSEELSAVTGGDLSAFQAFGAPSSTPSDPLGGSQGNDAAQAPLCIGDSPKGTERRRSSLADSLMNFRKQRPNSHRKYVGAVTSVSSLKKQYPGLVTKLRAWCRRGRRAVKERRADALYKARYMVYWRFCFNVGKAHVLGRKTSNSIKLRRSFVLWRRVISNTGKRNHFFKIAVAKVFDHHTCLLVLRAWSSLTQECQGLKARALEGRTVTWMGSRRRSQAASPGSTQVSAGCRSAFAESIVAKLMDRHRIRKCFNALALAPQASGERRLCAKADAAFAKRTKLKMWAAWRLALLAKQCDARYRRFWLRFAFRCWRFVTYEEFLATQHYKQVTRQRDLRAKGRVLAQWRARQRVRRTKSTKESLNIIETLHPQKVGVGSSTTSPSGLSGGVGPAAHVTLYCWMSTSDLFPHYATLCKCWRRIRLYVCWRRAARRHLLKLESAPQSRGASPTEHTPRALPMKGEPSPPLPTYSQQWALHQLAVVERTAFPGLDPPPPGPSSTVPTAPPSPVVTRRGSLARSTDDASADMNDAPPVDISVSAELLAKLLSPRYDALGLRLLHYEISPHVLLAKRQPPPKKGTQFSQHYPQPQQLAASVKNKRSHSIRRGTLASNPTTVYHRRTESVGSSHSKAPTSRSATHTEGESTGDTDPAAGDSNSQSHQEFDETASTTGDNLDRELLDMELDRLSDLTTERLERDEWLLQRLECRFRALALRDANPSLFSMDAGSIQQLDSLFAPSERRIRKKKKRGASGSPTRSPSRRAKPVKVEAVISSHRDHTQMSAPVMADAVSTSTGVLSAATNSAPTAASEMKIQSAVCPNQDTPMFLLDAALVSQLAQDLLIPTHDGSPVAGKATPPKVTPPPVEPVWTPMKTNVLPPAGATLASIAKMREVKPRSPPRAKAKTPPKRKPIIWKAKVNPNSESDLMRRLAPTPADPQLRNPKGDPTTTFWNTVRMGASSLGHVQETPVSVGRVRPKSALARSSTGFRPDTALQSKPPVSAHRTFLKKRGA